MDSATGTPLDTETTFDYGDAGDGGCDAGSVLPGGSVAMPVLLYLVFCLGLLGNATVVWVLLRYMKLRTMTDVCLLNLALSDLLMVLSLPLWASSYQHRLGPRAHGQCQVMTGVYQLGFYSGTLLVTLLSMDRYLAIVHAVGAPRCVRTLRCGVAASVGVWLVALAMTAPHAPFARVHTEPGEERGQCERLYPEGARNAWKLFRNFGENAAGLAVGLPVTVLCYARILAALQRTRNSRKRKAMRLVLVIVCAFVVCWVPYNALVFLETLQLLGALGGCTAARAVNSGMEVAQAVALAHCCVNPLIHAFAGEKFRRSLGRMLPASCLPCGRAVGGRRVASSRASENETSNTPVRSEFSRGS